MNRYMKGIGHLIKERVFMKKRLLSFIMSSLFTASLISSLSVYAEDSQFQKYTYNELSEMTDDEFLELVKHQKGKDYACYMFGNDDVSDETKLEKYLQSPNLPEFDISDSYIIPDSFTNDILNTFEEPSYYAYKQFINGKASPYLVFYVDRYKKMSTNITAEAFGYPKDWKLTIYDGVYEPFPGYKRQLHEYRVDVPMDVITDFEKYVRLEYSYDSVRGDFYSDNPYGINYFAELENQFVLLGNICSNIYGDANCDYEVDMSDAVLIMQALANPNKYGIDGTAEHHLTEQGKLNADMNGDRLTVGDAQSIQEKLLGLSDDENKQLNQNGTTDSNDLERTGALLKQFIAEQKDNGNYAFSNSNVYSQEDFKDNEGSIPEPFKDKIVVEYLGHKRKEVLESVKEFMENNNISEDLVFFIELQ